MDEEQNKTSREPSVTVTLDGFAEMVAQKTQDPLGPGKTFDPTFILIAVQIILALYQACRHRLPTLDKVREPGLLEKWALRNATRRVCGSQIFRHHGRQLVAAMLDQSSQLTPEGYARIVEDIERELGEEDLAI